MKNDKTLNATSIMAGVFFLIYALFNVGKMVFNYYEYGDFYYSHLNVAHIASFYLLSVAFFIKRKTVLLPIFLGMLCAFNFYWVYEDISYGSNTFPLLIDVLWLSESSLLFAFSLCSLLNKRGLRKIWFLPFLLSILSMLITMVYYISDFVAVSWIVEYLLKMPIYTLGVLFAGLALTYFPDIEKESAAVNSYAYGNNSYSPEATKPIKVTVASVGAPVQEAPAMETPVKEPEASAVVHADNTEEIRRYKQLLDDGIITQEEFEAKKRQLLGL